MVNLFMAILQKLYSYHLIKL